MPIDPLTSGVLLTLWRSGECFNSALLGGVIGNLLASAGYDYGLKPGIEATVDVIRRAAAEGGFPNHDLLRALRTAEAEALIAVYESCLIEDYNIEPRTLRWSADAFRKLWIPIGLRQPRILVASWYWSDLFRRFANPDARRLLADRRAAVRQCRWLREATIHELTNRAGVPSDAVESLVAAGAESAAQDVAQLRQQVMQAYFAVLHATQPDAPDLFRNRFASLWFDYLRVAFRHELKTSPHARAAFDFDLWTKISARLKDILPWDVVEKRLEAHDAKLDQAFDKLRLIHDSVDAFHSDWRSWRDGAWQHMLKMLADQHATQQAILDSATRIETAVGVLPELPAAVADELESRFRLHTATAPPEPPPLPPAPTGIVGRDALVNDMARRCVAGEHLLVLGPPGIGKSSVAKCTLWNTDVLGHFEARRYFVRCEALKSPDDVLASVATALEISGTAPLASVLASLRQAPALVILDNFETPWHDATAAVEDLTAHLASAATLLVTFRGGADGAPAGPAWSLPFIEPPVLDSSQSRELFRLRCGRPFAADAKLDALLAEMGGMPLALELLGYAARAYDSLDALAVDWRTHKTRLLQRGDADDPQTSFRASLALSLDGPRLQRQPSARSLLATFALLPTGIAEIDLKLLFPESGSRDAACLKELGLAYSAPPRIRLLPPIREYALADLEPSPSAEDVARIARHYVALVAEHGDRVGGEGGDEAVKRLTPEVANIEAAFLHLAAFDDSVLPRAAPALAEMVRFTGLGDGVAVQAAEGVARRLGDVLGQANCINSLGNIALARSDHDQARARYQEALPLYEQVGALLGQANCIKSLGNIALARSDHDQARARYQEALPLYEQVGDVLGQANCISSLGNIALRRSDHDQARARYQEALPLYEQVGALLGQANCVVSLGDIALERSDHDQARVRYQEALPLYVQVGDVLGQANCINSLGNIALEHDDSANATGSWLNALGLFSQLPEPYSIGIICRRLARVTVGDERQSHLDAARSAWASIQRPDLIQQLDNEFE
jgi:tetratricopeptide (TPR) repeat protein